MPVSTNVNSLKIEHPIRLVWCLDMFHYNIPLIRMIIQSARVHECRGQRSCLTPQQLALMTVPLYAPTDDCLRDIPEFIESLSNGNGAGQSVVLEEAIRQRNQKLSTNLFI